MEEISQKIQVFDIFPALEELSENETLTIEFSPKDQYDVSELIQTKKEIEIQIPSKCHFNILKNGVTIATCPFTSFTGNQWITFNYCEKKKNVSPQAPSSLALSLIDCIKLKIKASGTPLNNDKKGSSKKKPKNSAIRQQNLKNNKQNHNKSYEETINYSNYFGEVDNSIPFSTSSNRKTYRGGNINNSMILNSNPNNVLKSSHTPLSKTRNFMGGVPSAYNTCNNAPNTKKDKISNTIFDGKENTLPVRKNKNAINLNNMINKENRESKNAESLQKKYHSKNNSVTKIDKKKILAEKTPEVKSYKDKSNTVQSTTFMNTRLNAKKEVAKKLENNFNKVQRSPEVTAKDTPESYQANPLTISQSSKGSENDFHNNSLNISSNNNNNNEIEVNEISGNNNDNNENGLYKSLSEELLKLENLEKGEGITSETETFDQLKSDFNLLYTEEYLKGIPSDLLKLELELLIEKIFEIILSYHNEMSRNKELSSKFNELYKKASNNFMIINKKYNLLQQEKEVFQIKSQNVYQIKSTFAKQNKNLLSLNRDEISLFKSLLDNKEKKEQKAKLKAIMMKLLYKKGNNSIYGSLSERGKKFYDENKKNAKVSKPKPALTNSKKEPTSVGKTTKDKEKKIFHKVPNNTNTQKPNIKKKK